MQLCESWLVSDGSCVCIWVEWIQHRERNLWYGAYEIGRSATLLISHTTPTLSHVLLLINFIPCTKPSSLNLIPSLAMTWTKSEWVEHYEIVVKLIWCLFQLFSAPKFRQIIVLLAANHPQWCNILKICTNNIYIIFVPTFVIKINFIYIYIYMYIKVMNKVNI